MLNSILELDKSFKRWHNQLVRSHYSDNEIIETVDQFLTAYIEFNSLNLDELIRSYNEFLQSYSEDLKLFIGDGKYPFERDSNLRKIKREVYDITLILSTLVSPVRHNIMREIKELSQSLSGQIAIVGIGSGLDLEVIQKFAPLEIQIKAYDIELNKFVAHYFDNTQLYEEEFVEQSKSFDTIIAIELLEHLENPYNFVQTCRNSLKKGGRFIFTTATDMPQFDHLYKFNDDASFVNYLYETGLKIVKKTDFFHNYIGGPYTSKNSWYECKI